MEEQKKFAEKVKRQNEYSEELGEKERRSIKELTKKIQSVEKVKQPKKRISKNEEYVSEKNSEASFRTLSESSIDLEINSNYPHLISTNVVFPDTTTSASKKYPFTPDSTESKKKLFTPNSTESNTLESSPSEKENKSAEENEDEEIYEEIQNDIEDKEKEKYEENNRHEEESNSREEENSTPGLLGELNKDSIPLQNGSFYQYNNNIQTDCIIINIL